MLEPASWLSGVTDSALTQRTSLPLQFNKLDRIVGLSAGGNGMRAVMSGFAIHPSMTF